MVHHNLEFIMVWFVELQLKFLVLIVAGLPYSTDDVFLRETFQKYGEVVDGKL